MRHWMRGTAPMESGGNHLRCVRACLRVCAVVYVCVHVRKRCRVAAQVRACVRSRMRAVLVLPCHAVSKAQDNAASYFGRRFLVPATKVS